MTNRQGGFDYAKECYAKIGVDVDEAIKTLDKTPISIHCWQGDDVSGFENLGKKLTGGIQTTGNYPGRARNAAELRADIKKMLTLIPGTRKINIHASYLETGGKDVDRDAILPEHFDGWIDWAVANELGLDFNSTSFSHPKGEDGYTLSHKDKGIREFWIEHNKRCRTISDHIGKMTGKLCINDIWIHDGEKEVPVDTLSPRLRLKEALDSILEEKMDEKNHMDALESKLFGIGSECYVTGSHDFYTAYVAQRDDVMLAMDTGHYHPTEKVSGKLSALIPFMKKGLLLHVSRPERWDSDHVTAFDDETQALMREVVKCDALSKVNIATDYFDASINRIVAWVVGVRNTQKALLEALLMPLENLRKLEAENDFSSRLAMTEELKTMPFGAVWDYYLQTYDIPSGFDWIDEVKKYERDVQMKRG